LTELLERGVNLNSADWGCTPLLAVLDTPENVRSELASKLILAGADVNLLPSEASLKRRLAAGNPTGLCKAFDGLKKAKHPSVLRIFTEVGGAGSATRLLLDMDARPNGLTDAQAILERVKWIYDSSYPQERLEKLAIQYGAVSGNRR
jgi:hypothetical protein